MCRLFDRTYASSISGSFLREFTCGHVSQLARCGFPVFAQPGHTSLGTDPNLSLSDNQTDEYVFVAMVATTRHLHGMKEQKILVRADSALFGCPSMNAAITAGADVSVTA